MRGRSSVRAAAIALTVMVTAGLTGAASAAPDPPPSAALTLERHTITMITGDVLDLRTSASGDALATVRPAAGRENISYATRRLGRAQYLIPSDALPLLAAGLLDSALFNLNTLVAEGFDDEQSATIPLIVQYQPNHARAGLAGVTDRLALNSIHAESVRESKEHAATFWTALTGNHASLTGSVHKIWLNRTVRTSLTESVPQVGAPAAWASGFDGSGVKIAVLDTGIDATHPDLDGGKVIAEANFSYDTDTLDHFGHGTHVASIAAGTGEAAPAARKGVAPGAGLLNAKVLNSAGRGSLDQVVRGLEWAAAQGATVANLSLGFIEPTDGTDLLSQTVNEISRSSGMLVVVAAGNEGPDETTLRIPAAADEALTVGAVDKQDALAEFSSRGPRLGDYAIKPDITAPGTDIVAARAAGTELGPIVDGTYQQLSGTSMAAPHVAGAAAILAQQHPDFTNQQLKDTLISTAQTGAGQSVYEQGGGRLDVARAASQQIHAGPGTLNLGFQSYPHAGKPPVAKTVSYTNESAADVTLELTLTVSGAGGEPPPAGMFRVSQPRITVPAKGTASVTVSVDATAGPPGRYGGYLVASAGDILVHTTVGTFVEAEAYDVTVSGIDRNGHAPGYFGFAELWNLDTSAFFQRSFTTEGPTLTFRVPPGTYSVAAYIGTADGANAVLVSMAVVAQPQVEITGAHRIVLDARAANEIVFNTRNPTAPTNVSMAYHREAQGGSLHSALVLGNTVKHAYASPTAPVTKGGFEFYSKWRLVAPPLRMRVVSTAGIPLDPLFMANSPAVDGETTRPLVYVGSGRPEDYAGRDVHGRIALIQRTEGIPFAAQIATAAGAGAWAALIFNDRPGALEGDGGQPGMVPIPAFGIEQDPGRALVERLAHRPVWLRVSGTSVSPYLYDLLLPEKQRIPRSLAYTIDRSNTAEIDARYSADVPGRGSDLRQARRPYPMSQGEFARTLPRPLHRTEYVSANDTTWLHTVYPAAGNGELHGGFVQYRPGSRLAETWFGRVSRPGSPASAEGRVVRTNDTFNLAIYPFSDSSGHYGFSAAGDVFSTRLYTGGQLLKETTSMPVREASAVPQPATYRLVFNGKRSNEWSRYGTDTSTTWTFRSSRPAAGTQEHPPLPQIDYDLPLDQYNQATAQRSFHFTMNVGYVPGANGPGRARVLAWASFNGGATWKQLELRDVGGGKVLATVPHPRFEATDGTVSLRVTAADLAGNSIDQTLYHAYGLKPPDRAGG